MATRRIVPITVKLLFTVLVYTRRALSLASKLFFVLPWDEAGDTGTTIIKHGDLQELLCLLRSHSWIIITTSCLWVTPTTQAGCPKSWQMQLLKLLCPIYSFYAQCGVSAAAVCFGTLSGVKCWRNYYVYIFPIHSELKFALLCLLLITLMSQKMGHF